MRCRVCGAAALIPFFAGYHRCTACLATLADSLPDRETEEREYRLHQNQVFDPRYRRFLQKLFDALCARVALPSEGLDYGCGPGPALATMLAEAGHEMTLYDPLFVPEPAALERTYDFITCSEVAEHFHAPAEELDRLAKLLRPGGLLAIMTCFQTDDARFGGWHYRRDPTHVTFYRAETFMHLARLRGWGCEIPEKDVAILRL
jgi:SAM-dependent methyltransferase